MKNADACIKCGHKTIWQIDPLSFFDHEAANVILPLPVASRMIDKERPSVFGLPVVRKDVGKFIAHVCAACGYTELYATDIEGLAALQTGERGSRVTKLQCA